MRDFQKSQQKNPHRLAVVSRVRRFGTRFGVILVLVAVYLAGTMPPLRFQQVMAVASTDEGRRVLSEAVTRFLERRPLVAFTNQSLLFFRRSKLKHALMTELPIERVTVEPQYRARTLLVSATYKKPAATLQLPEGAAFLDRDGAVLGLLLEPFQPHDLLEVKALQPLQTDAGTRILEEEDLELYRALQSAMKTRNHPILWLILSDEPATLDFQMKGGWMLRIRKTDTVGSILARLDAFFAERRQQSDARPLEYVDLRFGEKVVSKEKGI